MLSLFAGAPALDRVNEMLKGVQIHLPDISVDESGVSVALTAVVCTDLSVRRLEVTTICFDWRRSCRRLEILRFNYL